MRPDTSPSRSTPTGKVSKMWSSSESVPTTTELRNPQTTTKFSLFNYEALVWAMYGSVTVFFVLDRFFWNFWPRETYHIGAGSAGSDFKDGLKPGPWSVQVYDAIARASGRYTILALNLVLFTMMHSFQAYLSESWLARRGVIDFTNAKAANRRLHIWNGVGIVVLTLAHVWTILLPCLTDGWSAQVVLGNFEWPLSERAPKGFKDADTGTRTMSLQGDDVYRIVEMTVLLAILLPLSYRWFKTRYHVAIHLHNTIQVLYFIDIVRRHTHPHSWILNTPFFVAWIVDSVVGFYWRRRKSPPVTRKLLSDDYILLCWKQDKQLDTVGPKYYLRLRSSSILERAHVFTAFENRNVGVNVTDDEGKPWSICLLIRVYNKARRIRTPKQDKVSHTNGLMHLNSYESDQPHDIDLCTWGPFIGDMCEAVMHNIRTGASSTVIASGSAAGYMIDALQQHVAHSCTGRLTLLYTTADMGVYEWVLSVIEQVLNSRKENQKQIDVGINPSPITAVLALTNGGAKDGEAKAMDFVMRMKKKSQVHCPSNSARKNTNTMDNHLEPFKTVDHTISLQFGRLQFAKLIDNYSTAFFQGSGALQHVVKRACKQCEGVKFVAGPIYDGDVVRKEPTLSKLRHRFFNQYNNA